MTNTEFQTILKEMYEKYPSIAKHERKTLNELVYVLRMSGEDYQINTTDIDNPGTFGCIPGVQDVFIPVKTLEKKVISVEFDEETYEEMGIKLLLVTICDDDEWFGMIRWHEDDLKEALEYQLHPATENNIAKLRSICNSHWFTDHLIQSGWEYMYSHIGNGDGWDK